MSAGNLAPIQQLKALVKMGIPFEQAYAQCWKDLLAKEKENPQKVKMTQDEKQLAKDLVNKKASKPKPKPKPKIKKHVVYREDDLPKHVGVINRMIVKGFSDVDICEMLNIHHSTLVREKKKYGLPIQEEKGA